MTGVWVVVDDGCMAPLPLEQTVALARMEQEHGQLRRLPEDTAVADEILPQHVTGTRLYGCAACGGILAIEPDGEIDVYELVPVFIIDMDD